MSAAKQETSEQISQHFELLDAGQLAQRLNLPKSWIREMCRARCADPLPYAEFGPLQAIQVELSRAERLDQSPNSRLICQER